MDSTTIKNRLRIFVTHLGIDNRQFHRTIGASDGYMNRESEPTGTVIASVLRQYPQLSPDWLLTGDGQMLRSLRSHPSVINTTSPIQSHSSNIHSGPIPTEESATAYLEATSASSRQIPHPQDMVSEPTLSDILPNHDTGSHLSPGTMPNRDTCPHITPGTMPNRDTGPHLTPVTLHNPDTGHHLASGILPNRDTITLPVRVYDELLDQLRKKDKQLEDAAAQIKHLFDMLNTQKQDQ